MQTEELLIEATRLFPRVHFRDNGELCISGRIISDHLSEFFSPLFTWVQHFPGKHIILEVNLDYLNSNGTFLLIDLLHRMEAREQIHSIKVIWHYEEEDESHYELGEIVREKLTRAEFSYVSYI